MSRRFELGLPLLALLGAGIFLGAVDQTVVVAALPAIIADLRIPFTQLDRAAWIVTAYLLGYTALMPLAGRLADVYGPRRAFLGGLALFAAGSLACAAAPGLWLLVGARALQAAGGGALLPAALAAAGDAAPGARAAAGRPAPLDGRAAGARFGVLAAVAEAGSVLGPLYGAALAERFGWRSIFWTNLPLAAAIAALLWLVARRRPSAARDLQAPAARDVDWPGAALVTAGLAAVTLALTDEAREPRPPALTAAIALAAIVLLTAFVWWERGRADPLLDVRLFRRRSFSAANLTSLLGGAALIVAMVNVPLWAQTLSGRGTLESGLLLMRMTLLIPIGALAGGLVTRGAGPRAAALLGIICAAGGLGLMARWTASPPEWDLTRDLALAGLGFGVLVPPLTATAIGVAGPARAGAAAALVTAARMVGMTAGLTALTTWGLRRFDVLARGAAFPIPQSGELAAVYQERVAAYHAYISGATLTVFRELFLAAAIVALVGLLPAVLIEERRRAPDYAPDAA